MLEVGYFASNTDDELHCAQACLIMLCRHLNVADLSMAEAEAATGFREGVATWPYAMLHWLGRNGCAVTHIDALSAEVFASQPATALEEVGYGARDIADFMAMTDTDAESRHIQECLRCPNVNFESRIPDGSDVVRNLGPNGVALVSLNATSLATGNSDEFDGHLVMVTATEGRSVCVQDPGPPARANAQIDIELLIRAMRSPLPISGAVTLVSRMERR